METNNDKYLDAAKVLFNLCKRENKIDTLKFLLRELITIQIKESNSEFTDDEIDKMVNVAVLTQLCVMLENAANAKQTICSFCKLYSKSQQKEIPQKYLLLNEQKRRTKSNDAIFSDPKNELKISDNLQKLSDNYLLRREQTQNEGIVLGRVFEYEKHDNPEAKRKINKRYRYDFITLCNADNLDDGLHLYNLLMLYKKPLEISSKKYTPLKTLEISYQKLNEFLNSFEYSSNRELVVKTLAFWKLEYSFRFVFATKIAKQMLNDVNKDLFTLPSTLYPYYMRIEFDAFGKKAIALSPFISEYDNVILHTFSDISCSKKEEIYNKIYDAAVILEKVYIIYTQACFIMDNNPIYENLTKNDFDDAANFLLKDLKILDVIKSYELDDLLKPAYNHKNNVFKKIKQLYLNGEIFDTELLNDGREDAKNRNKERNSRPNKSKKASR